MKVLFLDFDKCFLNKAIPSNYFVLSSNYQRDGVISVLNYTSCRSSVLNDFKKIFVQNKDIDKIFRTNKMILFLNFFYPLGQWISAINDFISQMDENVEKISVVFSSFSNNSNIFLFEAEGEINSSFLYHKSFFLSYYIKKYLGSIGINNVKIISNKSIRSKIFYFLRGFLVVNFKLFQLLFYKFFVFKRNYIKNFHSRSNQIIVSSRGVVHTQFMQGFLSHISNSTIAFINEGSARPFRNLKSIKNNNFNFFYAEGFLSIKQIFNFYLTSAKLYFTKKVNRILFMNISIDLNKLLPELGVFEFNMDSYSSSVLNSKNKLQESFSFKKFISFEMLFPFAQYVQEKIKVATVQIQTIAIFKEAHPNFVFADKLYFSNNQDFNFHSKQNPLNKKKYSKLENLKYLGLIKSPPKLIFKKITYFTQPIYENEEIQLLIFLKKFCVLNNYKLFVKLHPRSKMSNFKLLKLPFIDSSISSQKAINNSDLVITRDSSIGFDAWFLNIPILFFLHGMLKGEGLAYIPDDYKGKFNHMPSLIYLSNNLQDIVTQFYSHKYHSDFIIDENYLVKEILNYEVQ